MAFLSVDEALMFTCMLIVNLTGLSAHETLRDNIRFKEIFTTQWTRMSNTQMIAYETRYT